MLKSSAVVADPSRRGLTHPQGYHRLSLHYFFKPLQYHHKDSLARTTVRLLVGVRSLDDQAVVFSRRQCISSGRGEITHLYYADEFFGLWTEGLDERLACHVDGSNPALDRSFFIADADHLWSHVGTPTCISVVAIGLGLSSLSGNMALPSHSDQHQLG